MTNAEWARHLSRLHEMTAHELGELARGMWNPDFCAAESGAVALRICGDLRALIEHFEKMARKPARHSGGAG